MEKIIWLILFSVIISCTNNSPIGSIEDNHEMEIDRFNNVTLEMSLKPFKENNKEYISKVCSEIFTQWQTLLGYADTVSVMLWIAEGSEILDYKGKLDESIEWAKYIGIPNTEHEVNSLPDDETLSLHDRAFTYITNPPDFNYGDIKYIVSELKRTGGKIAGKPVRIGATFDPGSEFAKSEFKYTRHREVLGNKKLGRQKWPPVSCYSTLNADSTIYAGFPKGIPSDTPFGTFLGRQSQHFLTDMGFDFIWLSNGFGFGVEPWNATGSVFDGKVFHDDKISEVREKTNSFWNHFRTECPEFRIETRGTNLSFGIDLARDGVDLRSIYKGDYNLLPPPNSPWAAINGDFGIELAGYMSRIAELPDTRYLFRYYINDPWWGSSPWLHHYGREAHDIYLPMAVSRINSDGEAKSPTHLSFLTIDNAYGEMPVQISSEVIPHIIQGRRNSPDQAGPIVWIYPFDEYSDWAISQPERLNEIYYGDWFIRQAINDGFPINTVVSTKNFTTILQSGKPVFDESVLVSIVPPSGSELEKQLIHFVENGGQLMIYGPALNGGEEFLDFINVKASTPLSGDFQLNVTTDTDSIKSQLPMTLHHEENMSGGGIETIVADFNNHDTKILAQAFQGKERRDIVILTKSIDWHGGSVCYIRGTNSARYQGSALLTPDDPTQLFSGSLLMRYSLAFMGHSILYEKHSRETKNPINCISRHDNAYFFSGYVPNVTVKQKIKFPQGAPIFTGWETELKDGYSTYFFPKSFHEECRVFVEQKEGTISCFEIQPRKLGIKRRIGINGLKNANVHVFPSNDGSNKTFSVHANINHPYPWRQNSQYPYRLGDKKLGKCVTIENITGNLIVSW